jgi:CelD/BcsL family acetyltransferase involved in cellulose biosynthesis
MPTVSLTQPADVVETSTSHRLEVFRGREGLRRLRADWTALLSRMSSPRFFHFVEWYESYLATLENQPERMTFCAVYEAQSNQLAAVLPLKEESRSAGPVKIRTLELPRHEHMYLRDILISHAAREHFSLSALVRLLRQSRQLRWDILCLWHVLEDSATMGAYRLDAPRLTSCAPRSTCAYLPVMSADQLSKHISKNFRKQLRSCRKRADAIPGLRQDCISTLPDLTAALAEFNQVEASGWKGAAGTGTAIALDPKLVAFYQDLVQRFGQRGACEVHLIRERNKPIAGEVLLLAGGTAYALKVAYDEEYGRLSPSHLLHETILQQYAQRGDIKDLNFISDAPWHKVWKPSRMQVYNVYAFNRTLRGLTAAVGMRLAKARNRAEVNPDQSGSADAEAPDSTAPEARASTTGPSPSARPNR